MGARYYSKSSSGRRFLRLKLSEVDFLQEFVGRLNPNDLKQMKKHAGLAMTIDSILKAKAASSNGVEQDRTASEYLSSLHLRSYYLGEVLLDRLITTFMTKLY